MCRLPNTVVLAAESGGVCGDSVLFWVAFKIIFSNLNDISGLESTTSGTLGFLARRLFDSLFLARKKKITDLGKSVSHDYHHDNPYKLLDEYHSRFQEKYRSYSWF